MISTQTEQLLRNYFKKRLNHNQLIGELNEFETFPQIQKKLKRRIYFILKHSLKIIFFNGCLGRTILRFLRKLKETLLE
ncbi:hypothetical protein BpHYR1_017650 [Brachionus plicatilis]|uniref:Uncharacterized protein n=1 Tax=Brachionus plicatilis TaxID=10195 RepID=A0A3M7PZG5_BRAPC|nr:hypothetical protein BpHYR1_017650 [Brachionus plicatilis]